MSLTNLANKMVNKISNKSGMNINIAAVIMRGIRPVSQICQNKERNYLRGKVCPSIHAEASAMMCHFGKHLSYSSPGGWTRQCLKENKVKYIGGTG